MKPKTFQSMLAALMERNELSQREIALRAEISRFSLNKILSEDYAFRPARTIGRIVDAVECEPSERLELYRLAGVMPPEILAAFCATPASAQAIWAASRKWQTGAAK